MITCKDSVVEMEGDDKEVDDNLDNLEIVDY